LKRIFQDLQFESLQNILAFFVKKVILLQGHQSQMQNSIKLFENEKLTFIKKQKYPHVGNSLTFVNP
jgi:hypothetical protein